MIIKLLLYISNKIIMYKFGDSLSFIFLEKIGNLLDAWLGYTLFYFLTKFCNY